MQLKAFYINVDVQFSSPMRVEMSEGHTQEVAGFLQEFGCSALSQEAALACVEKAVRQDYQDDPELTVEFTWCGYIPPELFKQEIFMDDDIVSSPTFTDPEQEGIWYSTGHAYYCDSVEDI